MSNHNVKQSRHIYCSGFAIFINLPTAEVYAEKQISVTGGTETDCFVSDTKKNKVKKGKWKC